MGADADDGLGQGQAELNHRHALGLEHLVAVVHGIAHHLVRLLRR
jgi:hypothetical protein